MGSIIAVVVTWLAKHITLKTAEFVFWKGLAFTALYFLLPIALMQAYTYILTHVLEYAFTYLTESGITSPDFNIVGFAGCLVSGFGIGPFLSMLFTFSIINFTLKLMRLK